MNHNHTESITALAEVGRALTEVASLAGANEIYQAIEVQRACAAHTHLPKELRNVLVEMSIRAARRIGELLAEAALSRGGRPGNNGHTPQRQTLAALGLSKNRSSRWQRLASIPDDAFESHLADARNRNQPPSMASLLNLADALRPSPKRIRSANGTASSISAAILAADNVDGMGDLKDHLLHLQNLVQSRTTASAEKYAQAVDHRMSTVLREMREIVERIERSTVARSS